MVILKKLFLDTEFTALNKDAFLISIGVVDEADNQFYWEFTEWEEIDHGLSDWVRTHVIPKLEFRKKDDFMSTYRFNGNASITGKGRRTEALEAFREFISDHRYEVWSDVTAYDWFWFCELFGGGDKLPHNFQYIPYDLATLLKIRGIDPMSDRLLLAKPHLTEAIDSLPGQHHALYDAHLVKVNVNALFQS